MWPYGQTPPLEKCEQPDLKHPQAMLQNDICPQNSPEGWRVSPPGPRTKYGDIVKLQSALKDDYNNVSGKIKHVPYFRANN